MQQTDRNRRLAIFALAVLSLIWGYNWVVMKIAVHDAPPFAFAAIRTFGGGCALALGALILRKPLKPDNLVACVWIGIFQTTAFVGLVTWAVVTAGAGQVAMLSYTMPLWVSLLAWPVLGEKLNGGGAVAIAIAVAGIACMIGPLKHGLLPSVLALIAGVAWAIGVILTKRVQRTQHVDLYSLTMWQMLAGGAVLVLVALIAPEHPIAWTAPFILAVCYNVLLATALAYLLFIFVVGVLPARDASMGTLTNPVVGIVAAWIQLGEAPSRLEIIGMALVLAGLLVLTLVDRRAPVAKAALR